MSKITNALTKAAEERFATLQAQEETARVRASHRSLWDEVRGLEEALSRRTPSAKRTRGSEGSSRHIRVMSATKSARAGRSTIS